MKLGSRYGPLECRTPAVRTSHVVVWLVRMCHELRGFAELLLVAENGPFEF